MHPNIRITLLDTEAIYLALTEQEKSFTTPENVAAVMGAAVRVLEAREVMCAPSLSIGDDEQFNALLNVAHNEWSASHDTSARRAFIAHIDALLAESHRQGILYGSDRQVAIFAEADAAARAAPGVPAIPHDFTTHRDSWRDAITEAINNASHAALNGEQKAYWQHELAAFDRAFDELLAAPSAPAGISQQAGGAVPVERDSVLTALGEAFVTYMACPTPRNHDVLLDSIPPVLDAPNPALAVPAQADRGEEIECVIDTLEISGTVCEVGELEGEGGSHGILIRRDHPCEYVTIKGLTMDETKALCMAQFMQSINVSFAAIPGSTPDAAQGGA